MVVRSIYAPCRPLDYTWPTPFSSADYLTSEGQAGSADLQMIADAGFVVEGQEQNPCQKLAESWSRFADVGLGRQCQQTPDFGGCSGESRVAHSTSPAVSHRAIPKTSWRFGHDPRTLERCNDLRVTVLPGVSRLRQDFN